MGRKTQREAAAHDKDSKQNPTQMDTPPVCETIIEWLDKGFENYPGESAICFGQEKLSYNQLEKLSNRVANYLIESGVKKGDQVGISLRRSIEMIACMIGIFKSGAVFIPLDPNYPADRLAMMKEDANLNLLISHQAFTDRFYENEENVVFWERIEDRVQSCSDASPSVEIKGDEVAYIVFTSGSTGRPKGIEVPHRSLSNVVESQVERDYFKKEARLLQYSSISVDVSFQGIITTLATGGTVYLLDDSEQRDPRKLLKRISEYKIRRIFVPYVAFRSLVEVATTINSYPESLKEIITAGEQLRVDDAVRKFFAQIPEAILDNQYGASETHVLSSNVLSGDPDEWPDLPSIGTPMKNSSIYILDKDMQPVESGQKGELYLAGRTLACGYIGRDDLTKRSFIKNPFDNKNRPILYKSGDLGAYNKDGSIELLGRSDHQIKIRGYRVEPGEINSAGAEFSGIAQCFTHTFNGPTGNTQLITYYNSKDGETIDKKEFKSYLAQSLPDYMLPAFIMEIETIPYTPTGKVDFKALPKPKVQKKDKQKGKEINYETENEKKLARIWSEILGIGSIPRTSNYFDLGGDSLMAVTLFLRIENEFGKRLPLSTLAQSPTVAALSNRIEEKDEKLDISQFRSLQTIQDGKKDRAPLFMVHGGGGNVLMFRDLAQGLDPDIRVFGFQWPGWDGEQGENSILEMAKMYKKELRKAWPSGPYRLGGHCVGGIIALEIARLLRAEGAEIISPILVSDSPNLHAHSFRSTEPGISDEEFIAFREIQQKIKSQKYDARELGNSERVNGVAPLEHTGIRKTIRILPYYNAFKAPIKSFFNRFKYLAKIGKYTFFRCKFWLMLYLSKTIPVQDRQEYAGVSQIHAIKKYEKQIYDEDILYLRSFLMQGSSLGLRGWWTDEYMGFGEVCSGSFDPHIIGGGHNEIFKDLYAQKLIRDKLFSDNI